jgi:hypothetical protein
MGARPLEERRHVSRPRNGDTKPCPKCGQSASCEFNGRYRFDDIGVAPAWICGRPPCRYRELVRNADQRLGARDFLRQSRDLQARAKRQMMKCRALTPRSRSQLVESAARVKKES